MGKKQLGHTYLRTYWVLNYDGSVPTGHSISLGYVDSDVNYVFVKSQVRGSVPVRMTSCFICVDSDTLLMLN